MNYRSTINERESDSKGSFSTRRKRVVALLILVIGLLFAGANYTPTVAAGAQCPLVCGEPFIDPVDGQCYVSCCPSDPSMKCACERFPCK
jgi:hypothetical protein